ncbi:MAG: right-handed parallel beta-helix repeat-containing protein [Dehalococcoidia bacterium]|jgi:hypothetical protein
MKRLILVIIIIIAMCGAAESATYYVRADGSATKANAIGPASTASDCMSLATFNLNSFSNGDIINFSAQGGAYTTATMIPLSGGSSPSGIITYQGLPDGTGGAYPTFSGTNAGISNPNSYVNISNFIINYTGTYAYNNIVANSGTITNVTETNITGNGGGYGYGVTFSGNSSNIKLDTIVISNVAQNPIYLYGTANSNVSVSNVIASGVAPIQFNNIAGLRLYNISKSGATGINNDFAFSACSGVLNAIGLISHNATEYGVYVSGCSFSGVNTSLLSCNISGAAYAQLAISNSNNFTVAGSSIYKGTENGVEILSTATSHDINFVKNGIFENAAGDGITINSGYNYKIVDNAISNNSGDGVHIENASTPIHDVYIAYNKLINNGSMTTSSNGSGVSDHYNDYNITVVNNIITNNILTCLAFVDNSSGTATGNVCYNNGGPWLTLYGGLNLNAARASIYLSLAGVNPTSGTSWNISNNIVKGGYPREIFMIAATTSIVNMNNNIYSENVPSMFATLDGAGTNISWAQYHTSPNTYEPNSQDIDPIAFGVNYSFPLIQSTVVSSTHLWGFGP